MTDPLNSGIDSVLGTGRGTVSMLRRWMHKAWPHFVNYRQAEVEAELERRGYTVYMSHDGHGRDAVYVCQGPEQHPIPPDAPTDGFVVRVRRRSGFSYISRFGGLLGPEIGYARVWKTLRGATNAADRCRPALQAEALDMKAKR